VDHSKFPSELIPEVKRRSLLKQLAKHDAYESVDPLSGKIERSTQDNRHRFGVLLDDLREVSPAGIGGDDILTPELEEQLVDEHEFLGSLPSTGEARRNIPQSLRQALRVGLNPAHAHRNQLREEIRLYSYFRSDPDKVLALQTLLMESYLTGNYRPHVEQFTRIQDSIYQDHLNKAHVTENAAALLEYHNQSIGAYAVSNRLKRIQADKAQQS